MPIVDQPASESRTLIGSYAKLLKQKPKSADALGRLEAAFAHRLSGGCFNPKQADFWADMVMDWPEDVTAAVLFQVIAQYENLPSAGEIFRIKREYMAAQDKPKGDPTSVDRLAAKTGAPWWFTLMAKLQNRGFKMPEIGNELEAEAKRRNETLPGGLYLGGGRVS